MLIIASAAARGHPVLVIDGKGSEDFCRRVEAAATGAGRDFRAFTFRGRHHWNPCKHANPTQLRDLLAAIYGWNNPYFEAVAVRFLGIATQGLATAGEPATLQTLTALASPDLKALSLLLHRIPDRGLGDRLLAPLERPDDSTRSGIAGLGHRLGRLTETQIGAWLQPAADPSQEVDLLESATAAFAPVAFFSLNSLDYREAARDVGALVMQELQHVASALMAGGTGRPVYLVIDECSAFQVEQVLALLGKGREAGLCSILATQDSRTCSAPAARPPSIRSSPTRRPSSACGSTCGRRPCASRPRWARCPPGTARTARRTAPPRARPPPRCGSSRGSTPASSCS